MEYYKSFNNVCGLKSKSTNLGYDNSMYFAYQKLINKHLNSVFIMTNNTFNLYSKVHETIFKGFNFPHTTQIRTSSNYLLTLPHQIR